MASEIRVDKINSLSGVGTVTLSPTGVDIAGITTVATFKVGTGVTASSDGDIFFTGIATGNGSGLTNLATDLVNDTSPQLGGNLDVNTKNIVFGDSGGASDDRLTFGAGTDLSIYHDGTHTYLNNITGNLRIQNNGTVKSAQFEVDLIDFNNSANSTVHVRKEPAGNVKIFKNLSVAGVATVGSAVTISESGVEASGIGVTCANINGGHIGGRRNMIINGAMTLAQRGSTISAASYTTAAYGACDRWKLRAINTDEADFVVSQESDAPTGSGFSRSLKIKTNTVENTLDSNEIFHVSQPIEAQDLQHLKNGTSSALPTTLSFWVKAYQTGTFVVNLYKPDNTNRQITATYTISASNTWEFKTMTFPGDTSGGGINSDTGAGFQIYWLLASGSGFTGSTSTSWSNYLDGGFANGQTVNIFSSTSNYFYLTGVQLEIGTQATPFEHISFAENKRLCMRYFERIDNGSDSGANYHYFGAGYFEEDTNLRGFIAYKEQKRVTPTITFSDAGTFNAINTASMPDGNSIGTQYINTVNTGYTLVTNSVSGRDGQGGLLVADNTNNAYLLVDAEI